MLKIDSLTKFYGKKKIFNNISFFVQPGEIVGLIGENGAGKSTLLSILATLQSPSKGSFSLNELKFPINKKEIRKQIGFVPQEIALWEDFTVEENMLFFEKLSWVKKDKDQLRQLCLNMKLDKWQEPTKVLSGGMKRKLNLAISLIHDPKLLLLDEPTVGIDLKSKIEIGNHLKALANSGIMIVYTSHDMDEINSLCDRIVCIGEDNFYQQLLANSGKEILSF
ncbi:ABC transporter ATP-binding protein [Oceanobacillus senegalensis]|uniref:ABC transporter ATP-binding protein n=1 Tax=Oceanobacillus senegalensis TaxID=1936063 RepID=UPI000A30C992|nr:ATP-binding cassette domain-containing protein [Oceanobacillus senegalensis]